ncbi:MAG: GIY-YIG nuclease family protein [bacterium]|nr:GIY-YIG nuclease family protein [bacterium]
MEKQYFVYIMTNQSNTVLYTGVTGNIGRRMEEHKQKLSKGFTKRYNIDKLVYLEWTGDINDALRREKQIKGGSRADKIKLINSMNPNWEDLSDRVRV